MKFSFASMLALVVLAVANPVTLEQRGQRIVSRPIYINADKLVDAVSDLALAKHNTARANYGARPLQWSSALYPSTQQYAQQCNFAHRSVAFELDTRVMS